MSTENPKTSTENPKTRTENPKTRTEAIVNTNKPPYTAPMLPDWMECRNLTHWLAFGERGVSSNTIVEKITKLPSLGDFWASHPADVDDLRRCLLLLDQVPELVEPFKTVMPLVSPYWAALVKSWTELETMLSDECPRWRERREFRACIKTAQKMETILTIVSKRLKGEERRILRICSTCKHFIGEHLPKCGAGITVYEMRVYPQGQGGRYLLPCNDTTVSNCPKRVLLTEDEARREIAEGEEITKKCIEVRNAITLATGGAAPASGILRCPACTTGTVSYSVARNGHAQATCSTHNCIAFIE